MFKVWGFGVKGLKFGLYSLEFEVSGLAWGEGVRGFAFAVLGLGWELIKRIPTQSLTHGIPTIELNLHACLGLSCPTRALIIRSETIVILIMKRRSEKIDE